SSCIPVYCLSSCFFSFSRSSPLPHLHSFPTRRSSDLSPNVRSCRCRRRSPSSRPRASPSTPSALCSRARATSSSTLPESTVRMRSEEHTSELQSRFDLVCRLLLEKKKKEHTYLRTRIH